MATISTLEVDIKPTCFGYEIEDIIAMAQEIERGGYNPNSDWEAYKAGYLQGRTDAMNEFNKGLRNLLDRHKERNQ